MSSSHPSLRDSVISGNICHNGILVQGHLRFSQLTPNILQSSLESTSIDAIFADPDANFIQLRPGEILAPGLIELHTNGLAGVHFTSLTKANHEELLTKVAEELLKGGVTAWYATIPTVHETQWKQVRTNNL